MDTRGNAQSGFSLVELMVAMVITVIVTGAMFGLLTGGQAAFTTQPARTDRQQNMRMAMDVIMRDVQSAGLLMPTFVQTFTPALDGVGPGAGPPVLPPLVPAAGSPWDQIEILTNTSGFDNEAACGGLSPGIANSENAKVWLSKTKADIPVGAEVMVFFVNGTWTIRRVASVTPDDTPASSATPFSNCGGTHYLVELDSDPATPRPGQLGNSGAAGIGSCPAAGAVCETVASIGLGKVVRYRINQTTAVPHLERVENNGAAQILASGIEDLQVQYVRADGTVSQAAPAVVDPTYNSLITQVRVTVAARPSQDPRLRGLSTAATAGIELRASLQSQASPRQALWALTNEDPPPATVKWN